MRNPMAHPYVQDKVRSQLRAEARKGVLIDNAFKAFSRAVFTGAPPEQVHVMRICFFAGAAEMFALLMAGIDDGTDETQGDIDFMNNWVKELTTFHERTLQAMNATKTPERGN